MNVAEIKDKASEIQWFHNYELIPGVMTNGLNPISEYAPYFEIPQDLTGKRVLDIGCAEGYFTFLAESRGADVVAIDSWIREGFFLAHEVLNSKTEFHHMSVYNIHPDTLGMFDIVFFFGVYYHLKNPMWALERIASVTREYAIVESHIIPPYVSDGDALTYFCERRELGYDSSNWWLPSVPCLLRTVRAAGFPRAEFVNRYASSRGIVRAYKGPRTAGKSLTEDFFVFMDVPVPNTQTKGAILISGWALSQLEPKGGIERITIYLDNLDDPESRLGEARYGVPRPDLKSSVSRQYGNVGFEFVCDMSAISQGCHTLYALVEGKENWRYASVPITIGPSKTDRDSSADTQVPDALAEQHQASIPCPVGEHSILADYNAEIVRLRKLVEGYEQGRFMRLMRFLHNLRQGK